MRRPLVFVAGGQGPGGDFARQRAQRLAEGVVARLGTLRQLGLGYLTLDRATPTLSTGELQRLRLATQLSALLFGVVYVLDEPSAGLHPADSEALYDARERLRGGPARVGGGVAFSVDREGGGSQVGWRAKPHTGLIDLDRIAGYDPRGFWEEVHAQDGRIILDPGAFYILVSREAVTIPPDYAAEMAPYLAMVGEFRVHYAGFFDPGFGHASAGGSGSRGVLEVRCHEAPFVLEHGQVVGRLVYERMAERPDTLYGAGISSNYQGQGLKLAKKKA